jgi:hypothetical protein
MGNELVDDAHTFHIVVMVGDFRIPTVPDMIGGTWIVPWLKICRLRLW